MTDEELKRLIEGSAAETRRYLDERFESVEKRLDGMDTRFDGMDTRFDGIDNRLDGMDSRIDQVRRHMDVSTESLRSDIRLLAEGYGELDQKIDRVASNIRAEIREGFAQTHSLIEQSYAELDRRVSALEKRKR